MSNLNRDDKVSSCCGADFIIEKEWDDAWPEKGRWIGVMQCLQFGSVCKTVYPDEEKEADDER